MLPINVLGQAGFEIVPTFRTPHVTIAFGGDLGGRLTDLERLGTDRRANPYHEPRTGWLMEVTMSEPYPIDVIVDLNTMDETGLPWAFLDQAPHPDRVVPGGYVVAGSGRARAVALVVDITDGIVHVQPLRGSVASHAELLAHHPLAS